MNLELSNVANAAALLSSDVTFKNLRSLEISGNELGSQIDTPRFDLSSFKILDKINLAANALKSPPILPPTTLAVNISFNPLVTISNRDFDRVYNTLILILRNCSLETLGKHLNRHHAGHRLERQKIKNAESQKCRKSKMSKAKREKVKNAEVKKDRKSKMSKIKNVEFFVFDVEHENRI